MRQGNPFQSTHSLRSATRGKHAVGKFGSVSIHALLAECDGKTTKILRLRSSFNPRTPCGVRLPRSQTWQNCARFQSTHSLRSATIVRKPYRPDNQVSIHALLAECDRFIRDVRTTGGSFNPRTPCGVRPSDTGAGSRNFQFQSTHSLRSATNKEVNGRSTLVVSIHALLAECDYIGEEFRHHHHGFNPRTPCGVRLICCEFMRWVRWVSIHALLAECDKSLRENSRLRKSFNPRTPCGVRPSGSGGRHAADWVSIHALLAECDGTVVSCTPRKAGFNPRTPCGVRQQSRNRKCRKKRFQSTHSLRSATEWTP